MNVFVDRKFYYFLGASGRCKMLFSDRAVYSVLVGGRKWGFTLDRDGVADVTGFDRRTVERSLSRLGEAGLTVDGVPQQPPAGWFGRGGGGRPGWEWALSSYRVWSPAEGMGPGQAVLLGLLHSLAKGSAVLLGQTYKALAAMTGMDRSRVADDVAFLTDKFFTFHPARNHMGKFAVKFLPVERCRVDLLTPADGPTVYEGLDVDVDLVSNPVMIEPHASRTVEVEYPLLGAIQTDIINLDECHGRELISEMVAGVSGGKRAEVEAELAKLIHVRVYTTNGGLDEVKAIAARAVKVWKAKPVYDTPAFLFLEMLRKSPAGMFGGGESFDIERAALEAVDKGKPLAS